MAVLTVEVFALQSETDAPLTADEQFTVDLCFTAALATLNDHTGPDTAVINCDVTAYGTGALIHLLTMAPSAEHFTDVVAEHLEAVMTVDQTLFAGWELAAGNVSVLCSDN